MFIFTTEQAVDVGKLKYMFPKVQVVPTILSTQQIESETEGNAFL